MMADADAGTEGAPPADAADVDAAAADAAAPATAEGSAISEEEVSALLEGGAASNVRPFDLTTLRVSRTQLPMLETVSKMFASRMAATLSGLIGREATVQFTSLESLKAAELQAALPMPSSLLMVRLKPLVGTAFVTVQPALLLAMLDAFFGGTGRATPDAQAAIAPASQRFLGMVLRALGADWTAAWTPVTPLEVELVKQETNPRLMHLGDPQELLLVLKFGVEFGANSGRIDWLIPESVIAPIREMLASETGKAPTRSEVSWMPMLRDTLFEVEIETRAILAQAEVSLRDLVRLAPGDIIPIEPPQQATLLAGDVPLCRGRFGVSDGRNSLKLLPGGAA